ncbi:hypothetical protein HA402_007237 [Bradysia odoriphaga]|nr:hypothetical protein HA402_007237 [Bradysia odoriphaga]
MMSSNNDLDDNFSGGTAKDICLDKKDNFIRIKRKHICVLLNNLEKISLLFGVKLVHVNKCESNVSKEVKFACEPDCEDLNPCEVAANIQQYIDSLSVAEAEDSSYDSDGDADDSHEQVSRTTSDTLGQEFAEYVSQPISNQDRSPGYTQRVEFALKLGYTERLVQAALARLGPNPAQNELLAELIKLGAQQGNKSEFICDSPLAECLSPITDTPVTICDDGNGLRPIVIDGSNVAMSHGNKEIFSCRGIKLSVEWFKSRGHKDITVFVPKWRKESSRPDNPIKDQDILLELEKERLLVFTPSRFVGGKRTVCYDDRYILKLASQNDGIVVSNDNYRDLVQESCEFKKVVAERVLMYSFVNDHFMPPDDPLGRSGPTLDNFLRIQPKKGDPPPPCPYGKKCTYGNKCKFHHPERGTGPHKSVTERLSEHAARHLSARNSDGQNKTVIQGKSLSVPLSSSGETSPVSGDRRKPLSRTRSGVVPDSSFSNATVLENLSNATNQQNLSTNWDQSFTNQGFPKSHSIENISREAYTHGPTTYSGLWSRPQQNSTAQPCQAQAQCSTQISQQSQDSDDSSNLHRKLRRQLTLNPAGCDPRIYQMQMNQQQQQQQQQQPKLPQQHHSPHRPLAPSLSGPRSHHPSQWDLHQNVTRIASAPDPSRPWQTGPPPASTSEPHINLWSQHRATTPILSAQDHRCHIYYHLASIFPEEEVQTVMHLYPEETNPQTICAAILNMFPKM